MQVAALPTPIGGHPRRGQLRKKGWEVSESVQIDTLDVRPLPGVILKQFTARDVLSRCDILQVGTQATSASAARFL